MIMVKINDVSKRFKQQEVFRSISVEFEANKTHGIIGRNGSGKTVLLKLICGLAKPNSGTISVNGKVLGTDIECPDDMGIIIETPGFLSYQTGLKNLEYLASFRRRISKKDIINTIKIVGLDSYSRKHVGKYSLGMKQRLGIAQAIMENPSLILLDEPFNGLDRESIVLMRDTLKKIKDDGATIIIATHIKEDVDILCDNVYNIEDGEITQISKNIDDVIIEI